MAKKTKPKTFIQIRKLLCDNYDVWLDEGTSDYSTVEGEIYISSDKSAEWLQITPHRFSNKYRKKLLDASVCRAVFGSRKYYKVTDIVEILKESIKKNKSIFEICEIRKEKLKKKKAR